MRQLDHDRPCRMARVGLKRSSVETGAEISRRERLKLRKGRTDNPPTGGAIRSGVRSQRPRLRSEAQAAAAASRGGRAPGAAGRWVTPPAARSGTLSHQNSDALLLSKDGACAGMSLQPFRSIRLVLDDQHQPRVAELRSATRAGRRTTWRPRSRACRRACASTAPRTTPPASRSPTASPRRSAA